MRTYAMLVVVMSLALSDAFAQPSSRDPWLWPFAADCIWNQPIGSAATYQPANLQDAANAGVDIQHVLRLQAADPVRGVLGSTTFGPGRCSGTEDLGFSLRVPDSWLVPDAGSSPYGGTPNGNFALLLPGSDTVFEGSMISRCVVAGPVYVPDWMKWPGNRKYQNIRGDGISGGGQGASGMSALGGTIRKGELTGSEAIRHAIKINPFAARYCYYSAAVPGYRWPARAADGYASTTYKGTNPLLVMGSLLAIPPSVTEQSLGLTTVAGRKLFFTLQNFGMYFVEDAAWDTWDLIVERDAEVEFQNTYGFSMHSTTWRGEINKLMKALSIVTNNGPSSIGGGGTPLQALAPGFSSTSVAPPRHRMGANANVPAGEDKLWDISGRRLGRVPAHVVVRAGGIRACVE